MRNGNVFPVFPPDANTIQVAYEWALTTHNKGVVIIASKSPLPIRITLDQARQGLRQGAVILHESTGTAQVVLAVVGDMTLLPTFEAAAQLEKQGYGVRIVSVISPRRLYRPSDVAWQTCSEPDGEFLDDNAFVDFFGGDVLLAITGGTSGMLEPILLRSSVKRDTFCWQRGETTATPSELMAFNQITAPAMVQRGVDLLA